jgi:hypothetical protein
MRQRKTHCLYGHALTDENIYWCKVGDRLKRVCRQCKLRQKRESDARRGETPKVKYSNLLFEMWK